MNKLKLRRRRAGLRNCFAFRRGAWPIYETDLDKWDVYIESEGILGPRDLRMSKRQAIALAYSVSVSKAATITVVNLAA